MGLLNSPIAIVREAIKKSVFEKSNILKRSIVRQKVFESPLPHTVSLLSPFYSRSILTCFWMRKRSRSYNLDCFSLGCQEYKLILITKRTTLLVYLDFDATVFFLSKILIGWSQFLYHYKHFMFNYVYSCFLVTYISYFFHIKGMGN